MASIQELIGTVSQIKVSSDELSVLVGAAAASISQSAGKIAMISQGSKSGQEATSQVNMAASKLSEVASALRVLSSDCGGMMQEISSL